MTIERQIKKMIHECYHKSNRNENDQKQIKDVYKVIQQQQNCVDCSVIFVLS